MKVNIIFRDKPKITHSYYDTKTNQHLEASPELDKRFRHKAWESLSELPEKVG